MLLELKGLEPKKKTLSSYIFDHLNAVKDKFGIEKIYKSKGPSWEYVIEFKNNNARMSNYDNLKLFLNQDPMISFSEQKISKSSIPAFVLQYKGEDSKEKIRFLLKYDLKTARGLVFEDALSFILSNKPSKRLFHYLQVDSSLSNEQVSLLLKQQFPKTFSNAIAAKKALEQKFGNITDSSITGASKYKADIIIDTEKYGKNGISLKQFLSKPSIPKVYNKRFGDGYFKSIMIDNPREEPWFITARKQYFQLMRQHYLNERISFDYKPKNSDVVPPKFMNDFFRQSGGVKSDMYQTVNRRILGEITDILVENLKNLPIHKKSNNELSLEGIVEEGLLGKLQSPEEEKRMLLYQLKVHDGEVEIELISPGEPDMAEIDRKNYKSSDLVKTKGIQIILAVPGMEPFLIINGIKWAGGNFMLSNLSQLEIKGR